MCVVNLHPQGVSLFEILIALLFSMIKEFIDSERVPVVNLYPQSVPLFVILIAWQFPIIKKIYKQ